jgi:predicted cupin superfamily sugar epimerase
LREFLFLNTSRYGTAQDWIERLQLGRHPEGGWFRETYRSDEVLRRAALPPRFGGDRSFSTAIYFLLEGEDFSALHRIHQDEIFHFYDGSGLTLHVIDPAGCYATVKLGRDLAAGELPQATMTAGSISPISRCRLGTSCAANFRNIDRSSKRSRDERLARADLPLVT